MRHLIWISVMALSLIHSGAMALTTFDKSCTSLKIKSENKEIVLPGPDQPRSEKIYVFKNLTEKSIWIDHPVLHPSASAGWSSYLRRGNASALLVNRKNFNLSCAVITPGKVEYLDCAKSVSVCEPDVTLKSLRKGTYWLAEDKPWDDLMALLAKRGVDVK